MASALSSAVVIECPHCGTRYRLPAEAIGPSGRKVACAHCGETWQADAVAADAGPAPDPIFDEAAESALDEAFASAERAAASPPAQPVVPADPHEAGRERTIAEIKAAIAPRGKPAEAPAPQDPKAERRRQKAFADRQAALSRSLPAAKIRGIARVVSVGLLAVLLVGGVAFRTEIVRQYPEMAGFYAALGLGVNVVGLQFRDVTTLVSVKGGTRVMQVDARIFSEASRTVAVPPVVVRLLDGEGRSIYEWSAAPGVRDLQPGEVVDFSTQLTSPPEGARQVRLTFNDGRGAR